MRRNVEGYLEEVWGGGDYELVLRVQIKVKIVKNN